MNIKHLTKVQRLNKKTQIYDLQNKRKEINIQINILRKELKDDYKSKMTSDQRISAKKLVNLKISKSKLNKKVT